MGRKRREPKDDKDAKELERLRKNQAACRQRKLDKCDEYKAVIDNLESNINQKFHAADVCIRNIHVLRDQLEAERNFRNGWHEQNDRALNAIFQRIQSIQREIQGMKEGVQGGPSQNGNAPTSPSHSAPSTSRDS